MGSTIGGRLRARAAELELSDAEVARRLGLAQSRYAHYVSGTRAPDYGTLARICRVLATSPDHLLGFTTTEQAGAPKTRRLRDRVVAATAGMSDADLQLAVDLLDVIARQTVAG